MADRVHPTVDSPRPSTSSTLSDTTKPPSPPPGTYVIQLPKDQIYRVPPPENAHRFQLYTRQNRRRRNPCRSCLFCLLAILILLIILLGITVAVFYLVVRPKSPNYSIDAISVSGLNLLTSSSSSAISPLFNLTVRADNPNKKIGIYYLTGSSVRIYFSNEKLSEGVLPDFFQPAKNVSVLRSVVRGTGVNLSSGAKNGLIESVKQRVVVLKVEIGVPIKVKVGAVKSWKMRVKVNCDVTVDELTTAAKIVKKNCDYSVKIW
ncbi:protein YLS9-like [Cucumis melo var. makuwa]|uniref:Protein YLS9-like n=2 Tax=Cucumis melo TaxID=3656 RepID=A0A5A7UIE7_CUCMM|nr:NDR1/HIN1-like protein 13 [Cucumis melo]KAA0055663.1 protein YLS9-like [Cucumis melo var. makuwa]